ncbi:MAG: thioredoxin-disulfide reductase [SAR324 cluster bacterium]|uniref:Thioredoxin reductase n=1 Tax=SAR324 cluster bacterium TaxID=2024889 RepID=A0A2A4SQU0_9DELT|nr:MAG: thioredoxin-disulfide reductase [SAR324 cluster bacterium]
MKKPIIYSKDYCPYCDKAKELLKSKGVAYEEIRIDLEVEQKDIMIERSGGRRTVPQIFIEDFHVGGCDELFELDAQGKLDDLLELEKKENKAEHRKVIIMGSGPAGYTAAIYAARANLAPTIISGPQKGGQLTTTTDVDNFPGFSDGVDGNELMTSMEKQAKRFGTEIIFGEITKVDLSQKPFKLYEGEKLFTCDALIISTGASARYLGLGSESKYKNRGVSACATCDGFFFKGQKVAVVGGGDTALEEATYLTNFCEKVFLIHRRDEFRASKAMQERAAKNEKIEILWDSAVDEVLGDDKQGMTDLRVRNLKTGETKEIGAKGLFVAIGHTPNTTLFKDSLEMDENNYLRPEGDSSRMNVPGVFACGDVMDSTYRQAITAAGSGCKAAMDAERWLGEQEA